MVPQSSPSSAYPPDLTLNQSTFLADSIKDWSLSQGLAFRPRIAYTADDIEGNYVSAAPVTLFPSLFPQGCFEEALELQRAYNCVYAGVAADEEWLGGIVEEIAGADDFIARLWDVHLRVKEEGYVQDLTLGIFRSDYMLHQPTEPTPPTIRQVEFNTIASGMGGLSSRVSALHRHLLESGSYPDESPTTIQPNTLPPNDSIEGMGRILSLSHKSYGPSKSGHQTCIIFPVHSQERNAFDQRLIEYSTVSYSKAPVFRVPFGEILQQMELDEGRNLIYTPPAFSDRRYEVTTVYFRAGYAPQDYDDDHGKGWQARLLIERSTAIKCPSVLLQLAGCKRVQQILASPGSRDLARFLPDQNSGKEGSGKSNTIARLTNTFASMYPMDTSCAGLRGRQLATNPMTARHFVLKPQREGGGNNVYREAIPQFLKKVPEAQWSAYILMEIIEAPVEQENYILRDGVVSERGKVVCELGVFGSVLWRGCIGCEGSRRGKRLEVLANEEIGHLLRTKGRECEEGRISAGLGALDSVCLAD